MVKYIRYCLFTLSFLFLAYGLLFLHFNIALVGVLLVFVSNLIYSFEKLKNRVLFLTFNFMIFVFLLSRPAISFFRGDEWWYFRPDTITFALVALFLSLVFLQVGAVVTEQYLGTRKKVVISHAYNYFQTVEFISSLQTVTLILFYVTMAFFFAIEMEKLLFMRGKDYAEFYILYKSSLPYAIQAVSQMMKFVYCLFLATLPSKKLSFVPSALFVLSAVPSLIIGMRNPIVLNILFVLLYYYIRDFLGDTKKWLGKFEKGLIIVTLPAALLFLSAYNYIREGTKMATSGAFSAIVDLFYKQGVSFDVLGIGYESIPFLPNVVPKNYTFGLLIDYFLHDSTVSRVVFGAMDLGKGNSVIKAVYGNSLAHSMSYVAKSDYLQGHGWGTSYILETFIDYGYLGVILYSAILGGLLILLMYWLSRKSWFCKSIILMVLTSLFFTPRAEAISSITFITQVPFWFTIVVCFVAAALCSKQYSFAAGRKRRLKVISAYETSILIK